MSSNKKLEQGITSAIEKDQQKQAETILISARAAMAMQPHFVPIQIDGLNILELTLKGKIAFAQKEQTEAEINWVNSMKKKYAEQKQALEETGKKKAGRTDEEELEAIYRETIGKALGLIVYDFKDLKNQLLRFIKARHKNSIRIIPGNNRRSGFYANGKKLDIISFVELLNRGPAIVYLGGSTDNNILGVMYASYSAAGTGLFTPFFNQMLAGKDAYVPELRGRAPSLLQISEDYIKTIESAQNKASGKIKNILGIDIGHLAGTTSYIRTVLQQKIENIRTWLDSAETILTQDRRNEILGILDKQSNKLLSELSKNIPGKQTYGQLIENKIIELRIDQFFTNYNIIVVVPQERFENQYFFGTQIEYVIAKHVRDNITEYRKSPTLTEFITTILVETLKKGKLSPNLKNYKSSKITKLVVAGVNKKLTSIKFFKGTVKKGNLTSGKLNTVKKQKPVSETVVDDTITLQKLLDANLVQTIKQNMGSGNRRDILNLRSGRFAESVQVNSISQSRQGMITAFYTYMRNPYATFSEGGRQQNPRSRDPKLLISKSIRQLAQQITQQRLRAVLV